jgi:glycosyltransferase involved in cell wall biosynthesis
VKVALVHNFHASDTPSGEDAVVSAEVEALTRAGVDARLFAVSNDTLGARRLGSLRAAATISTGVGWSPLPDIAGFAPDVVHVHNLFPYIGSRWLRRTEAPIVATAHNYRALCANGYLFRAGEVCTRCVNGHQWSGVRYGCYRDSHVATVPHAIATRRGAVRDPVLAAAARVLVLSQRARSIFGRAGVPEAKLRLDSHFVPEAFAAGANGARDDAWVFIGRLSREKGIDRLIAEWPPGERLRVLGDGPLRPELQVAAAGKRIEFLGRQPRAEVLAVLRRSFGLVFPSRWYETFGLVYIEALAAGVPTVALPPNVVAEAVATDGTGLVAAWGSLAATLTEARDRFDGLRSVCRHVFEDRYAEAPFVARRLALYRELTG